MSRFGQLLQWNLNKVNTIGGFQIDQSPQSQQSFTSS